MMKYAAFTPSMHLLNTTLVVATPIWDWAWLPSNCWMVITWLIFYYSFKTSCLFGIFSILSLFIPLSPGCRRFTWCNNTEQVHLEMVSTHSPSEWWLAKVVYHKQCLYSTNFWDSPAVTITNKAKTVWCDTISTTCWQVFKKAEKV